MKVSKLIEELNKCRPDDEVILHYPKGETIVCVAIYQSEVYKGKVGLYAKSDINMKSELYARFYEAPNHFDSELDFFLDLLDSGFTLDDIKEHLPDRYSYSHEFMKEHGLI